MHEYDLVFCDSCLGGSTVAARFAATRIGQRALYFADYACNPLGLKGATQIEATLAHWRSVAHSVSDTLVIACNTASVLHDRVRERWPTAEGGSRTWSMVDLTDALMRRAGDLRGARACLMGTQFTVTQAVYRDRLLRAGAREVVPLAATVTERVVARLQHTSPEGRRAIADETADVIRTCDAVLLACTCFPMAADVLREIHPACLLLDPATGVDQVLPTRAGTGPNRLTIALTGAGPDASSVRDQAPVLFPGWEIDEIVESDLAIGRLPGDVPAVLRAAVQHAGRG